MTIFSFNNTAAPTSSSSFSNMNLFGSTSGIQQTSNSSVFGTMNSSSPFGASSSSFSNMNLFGSTSGIQQTSNSSVFGTMNSSSPFASSSSFSNMKIFGSTSGIQQTSNSSVFGTMNSSPFGGKERTTPLIQSSGFGKSAFGSNQKGSRTSSYIATPEIVDYTDTLRWSGNIQSICGMQTYKDKSHEELRFEDYQLDDKGQKCGALQSTLCLNCLKQSQPTPPGIFNVSSTPLVASQNTPEMTPKVGATLATTNTSHPSTSTLCKGASFSEIGQGVGQQPKHQWPTVNPSPIMPPVETQPSVQISIEHPNLATSIQYGISSLPVAFFMDRENASGLPRTEIIIRNPRDWVCPTAGFHWGPVHLWTGCMTETKLEINPKLNPEEMLYKDVDCIMPKLQRPDYYTVPPMEELISKEKEEAGFCRHVKDFVVGRHGYGSIKFLGETDVRKLDLDSAVQFNHREVIMYMDERKKPPVGQGLNRPAEITLLNVRCISRSTGKVYRDGPMVNKYRDMLIKKAVEQDAEFISYDPVEGQWKFRVSHF